MKTSFFFYLFVLVAFSVGLRGQEIREVRVNARQDLQDATRRLAEIRKQIEDQKIPIAQKVASQERGAAEKRKELDRRLRLRDNRDASLLQLKEEVQQNESELESSLRLLKDYARSWRQATPPSEQFLWSDSLAELLRKDDQGLEASMEAYLQILQLSND